MFGYNNAKLPFIAGYIRAFVRYHAYIVGLYSKYQGGQICRQKHGSFRSRHQQQTEHVSRGVAYVATVYNNECTRKKPISVGESTLTPPCLRKRKPISGTTQRETPGLLCYPYSADARGCLDSNCTRHRPAVSGDSLMLIARQRRGKAIAWRAT